MHYTPYLNAMRHSSPFLRTTHFTPPSLVRFGELLAIVLGFLPGCSDDDDTAADPAGPDKITVPQAGLHPEGIQYDAANQHFFVSSRTQGRIGTVKDDSTYTQFADDARLVSTIGLNLDASRNRLLVAVSDNGANTSRSTPATLRQLAALAIYNTTNGTLSNFVNLGTLKAGSHFANDIAVDSQGNAYITDSLSPIIYQVNPQGIASIFLENTQLSGSTGFGLNGIVFHPDGYLLVAKSNDGALFKVPLSNPTGFTRVTTSQNLTGADGMLLQDNRTLLVVSGSQSTVFRISSSDGWVNASSSGSFATGAVSPTTITRRGTDAYVLYPYQATSPRFAIVKAKF